MLKYITTNVIRGFLSRSFFKFLEAVVKGLFEFIKLVNVVNKLILIYEKQY